MIDSYIQYGQSSEKTFYQVQNTKEQVKIESTDQQIASVYIRLDSQYDIYERRIYSVGELLGQIKINNVLLINYYQIRIGINSKKLRSRFVAEKTRVLIALFLFINCINEI